MTGRTAQQDELDLVARAQQGDRAAFGELVRRYYPGAVSVVYRMCGDGQMAEDAAQEAFLQAWLHLSSYRPRSSSPSGLRNWLYRIAVNAAVDILRRERQPVPQDVDDLPIADPQPGPEASLVSEERAALVKRAVLALSPASRAVLVLREYEGLSYQEIAATLDIPVGTVMSRLNYARSQLRTSLESHLLAVEVQNV
ncbi:MAG: sigma-70 family RNA polymerase sigma factor [Anaerolineales bacterium]|nr:sigma-70 family RNA polymerase sigma factor [Anaerolineales bacterium]